MASGNSLIIFHPYNNEPPGSAFATLDTRNAHIVLDFDKATDEFAVFSSILPRHYNGGGITVYIHWSASGVITGDVVWSVQFERIGDGQQDVDSDGFAAAKTVTASAPTTDGFVKISNIAFTDGAEIDSIAFGEKFRLKIARDADNASDTMDADAELHAIELKET
jgi:hypothetical protein